MTTLITRILLSSIIIPLTLTCAHAQSDPGPRGGPAGAGGYYSTLNAT